MTLHRKDMTLTPRMEANQKRTDTEEVVISMVQVDGSSLHVESGFCYLGDMFSAGGGCMQAIIWWCLDSLD